MATKTQKVAHTGPQCFISWELDLLITDWTRTHGECPSESIIILLTVQAKAEVQKVINGEDRD